MHCARERHYNKTTAVASACGGALPFAGRLSPDGTIKAQMCDPGAGASNAHTAMCSKQSSLPLHQSFNVYHHVHLFASHACSTLQKNHERAVRWLPRVRGANRPPSPSVCIGICLIRTQGPLVLSRASAIGGAWALGELTRATEKWAPANKNRQRPNQRSAAARPHFHRNARMRPDDQNDNEPV